MRDEIGYQVEDLTSFSKALKYEARNRGYGASKLVFTGSGDSYASSLFAHYFSGGLATVADPYELQNYAELSRNKTVYITSVTGRTRANIQLARKISSVAKRRIAVTANPASKLAQECDETIQLKYRTPGVLTAGTIGFTSSLIALASQIQPLRLEGLDDAMRHAVHWAQPLKLGKTRRIVFVGSGTGYAIAAYGAFKIHEVLGLPADYQHAEQLGHSQLFSLSKSDMIVFLNVVDDEKTETLYSALRRFGFEVFLFRIDTTDQIMSALEGSFAVQHLALGLARSRGQTECAFLSDKKRLDLSGRLIY